MSSCKISKAARVACTLQYAKRPGNAYSTTSLLTLKGALQLLINRYGYIRFAQVPERVSIKSVVVSIIGNSKSFHLGAQDSLNPGNF